MNNFKHLLEVTFKKPTLKQMSVEDLQWELDKAIEKNSTKRAQKIQKELDKRGTYKTV